MEELVATYLDKRVPTRILDVGANNINGCYRPLFNAPQWQYVGADIEAGENVDVVLPINDNWPVEPQTFDVVISGQCLEHCKFPWLIADQMRRAARLMGLAIVIAPNRHQVHKYPIDCWRILDDGMVALMDEWAGFATIKCEMVRSDTVFVGSKRVMQ